jgi:hypothetical protein
MLPNFDSDRPAIPEPSSDGDTHDRIVIAARRRHVFVLEQYVGGDVWMAHDANSGGRATRIHTLAATRREKNAARTFAARRSASNDRSISLRPAD